MNAPIRPGIWALALLLAGCTEPAGRAPLADRGLVNGATYVIGGGDEIEVRHTLDPDYSATALVAPDGRITLPGIDRPVAARGRSVAGLTAALDQAYRRSGALKQAGFTVALRHFGSQVVFVGGEVQRPGVIALPGGIRTIWQAVMAAGGPLGTAALQSVLVLRAAPDGHERLLSSDLTRVVSGEDLSQNALLQPMDVVIVPRTAIASLDIWVDQYIRQALPLSAAAYLQLSNGPVLAP